MSATDLQLHNLYRVIEKQNYLLIELLDELKKLNEKLGECDDE